MPDEEKLAAVRAALPAVEAGIYLNAGSVGPLPAETARAMADLEAWELRTGRAHVDYFEEFLARMDEARGATAAVLGTDVDAIALNHSTTDGMNQAIAALDWRPGDRAVSSQLEHAGGVGPLHALHARLGVDLALVDAGTGGDDEATLAAFDAAITPGTRLVALAHVSPMTGALLPVTQIAELAHARGALVVVDGAQAAGAIPVDLPATGADFYAIPAHKWLLGPEGMGALAVGPGIVERLYPGAAGSYSFEAFDPRGEVSFWTDARRFDASGFHRPSVVGMARSIGWLSMYVGLDWIHARGQALAAPGGRAACRDPGRRGDHAAGPDGHARDVPHRLVAGAARPRGARRAGLRDRAAHRSPRRAADQRWLLGDRRRAGAVRGGRGAARGAHARNHAGSPDPHDPRPGRVSAGPVRHRSWVEVRWRQFRNAPRPVVRAVASSLTVAVLLAAAYLAYDVALSRGAVLPGGDLRVLAITVYVLLVLAIGSLVTWLIVPLPSGSADRARRTPWSAALGFFAAVPIAYLVMVAAVQILRPLLV